MNAQSLIDFKLNGKMLMYDGKKTLDFNIVNKLSQQRIGKDGIFILAPNGVKIKGVCKFADVAYNKLIQTWFRIKNNGCTKDRIDFQDNNGMIEIINNHKGNDSVIATIQPFTIQLDLTKDFKLYRVTNIHQVSKSKIYAPNGFEVCVNGFNLSNSCKALEYYYEYTKGYSWQKGNYVLQYNDMYDFDSNEEHNRCTKRLSGTDKVELRFYQS